MFQFQAGVSVPTKQSKQPGMMHPVSSPTSTARCKKDVGAKLQIPTGEKASGMSRTVVGGSEQLKPTSGLQSRNYGDLGESRKRII